MLSKIQKEILRFLQGNVPLRQRPYRRLALRLEVNEQRIVEEIKKLKKNGYIRRMGGILGHRKIGLKENCMCVWKVPEKKINKTAKIAAAYPNISHCVLRKTVKWWPYNLYTMIHGRTKTQCRRTITELSEKSGIREYKMLFTRRQYKKVSPRYEV